MPSSRFAVRKIMRRVPKDAKRVIEYGPGDGVLTRRILECLPPDGRLLAIETNPDFCRMLEDIGDPRLIVVNGDATHAADYAASVGIDGFDLAISGIPFSYMSAEKRSATVAMTHRLLSPRGVFLAYQVSPLMVPYLRKRFALRTGFELRNLPPYFIMEAKKRAGKKPRA